MTGTTASGVRGVDGRLRLPAAAIESLVTEQLAAWLEAASPTAAMDALAAESAIAKARWQADMLHHGVQHEQLAILLGLQVQVAVHADRVSILFTPPDAEQPVQLEVAAKLVDRGSD